MNKCITQPLKVYIQDIYRAERSEENKYIYKLFDINFKNVLLHGMVTSIYNYTGKTVNFELTDSTGTIQVYYDSTKNNCNVSQSVVKSLKLGYQSRLINQDEHISTIRTLKDRILSKNENPIKFSTGDYVFVIGDIFIDDIKKIRMISGYECNLTSIQREIIWMEELQYLYEKFYLWKKK